MATISDTARKRVKRLSLGYPLSTGETLDKPMGKPVSDRSIISQKDMERIRERLTVEQSQGVRRHRAKGK